MGLTPGAYLGGIRAVEDLRQRCRVDEDTGCWHWRLAFSQGSPRVHFLAPDTGAKLTMRGRRAALYLERGRALPKGHLAFPRGGVCTSADCVNPAHARSGTLQQQREAQVKAGTLKQQPRRIAANRATARTHRAKLDMEKAREIRASDETIRALAQRYGVSHFCVWSIKRGHAWREQAVGASVFDSVGLLTQPANDPQRSAA